MSKLRIVFRDVYCPSCNQKLVRGKDEPPVSWLKRKYCNRTCYNKARFVKLNEKRCLHCNKIMIKKFRESPSTFIKRIFCSQLCHARSLTAIPLVRKKN